MSIHIPAFENARVLVIGDVMLDRYWYGGTHRISPEAPVPVVQVNNVDERPGGAGNVALNIAALTSKAILLGVVGNDREADVLENKLSAAGVACQLQRFEKYPTVTKLRVLSLNQQLIRLDFEQSFHNVSDNNLQANYLANIRDVGAVIISDYHKGTLQNVPNLIKAAKEAQVPIFIDPKGTNFSIYRGASVLTPNRKEFEAVVGPCTNESEIVQKGLRLLEEIDIETLLVTRGAEGMSLIRAHAEPLHLPAQAREVYDVSGAGDTVIAMLATAVAAGENIETAMRLANVAAGIVVTKLGAATVNIPELRRELRKQHASSLEVLTEEDALIAVQDARAHGETIVMTNGCFDILHVGHVQYLEQASALGHRLLVAVNDDASVARLKGNSRPINSLEQRMLVLAALQAVDWVVPFAESTPERLIRNIKPDVLVKGGDYKIADIAGAQFVLDNGGDVKIVDFTNGCSTTEIIKKIQKEKV